MSDTYPGADKEIPWERWARDRLAYLDSLIRVGQATDDHKAEAEQLRQGLS